MSFHRELCESFWGQTSMSPWGPQTYNWRQKRGRARGTGGSNLTPGWARARQQRGRGLEHGEQRGEVGGDAAQAAGPRGQATVPASSPRRGRQADSPGSPLTGHARCSQEKRMLTQANPDSGTRAGPTRSTPHARSSAQASPTPPPTRDSGQKDCGYRGAWGGSVGWASDFGSGLRV